MGELDKESQLGHTFWVRCPQARRRDRCDSAGHGRKGGEKAERLDGHDWVGAVPCGRPPGDGLALGDRGRPYRAWPLSCHHSFIPHWREAWRGHRRDGARHALSEDAMTGAGWADD